VTGGVSDAKRAPDVLSLGTAYNQPFWIFYSSNQQLDQLSQLKGKRIAVGPVGSRRGSPLNKFSAKAAQQPRPRHSCPSPAQLPTRR
jgi:TRAP-type uncharacterized transport system substrate-binding protein